MPNRSSRKNNKFDATQVCVEKLRVLADPTRLAVVERLLTGPRSVSELNVDLDLESSLMSHHLRVLRKAKLVQSHRKGKSVIYELSPEVMAHVSPHSLNLGCCVIAFDSCCPPQGFQHKDSQIGHITQTSNNGSDEDCTSSTWLMDTRSAHVKWGTERPIYQHPISP